MYFDQTFSGFQDKNSITSSINTFCICSTLLQVPNLFEVTSVPGPTSTPNPVSDLGIFKRRLILLKEVKHPPIPIYIIYLFINDINNIILHKIDNVPEKGWNTAFDPIQTVTCVIL